MAIPGLWGGIVKVQRELTTDRQDNTVLIYNRTHKVHGKFPMNPSLLEMFGDEAKIYCYAVLNLDGVLDIKHKVKPRGW